MTPVTNICPCCHAQNNAFLFDLAYGDVYKCVNCKTAFTVFYRSEVIEESNEVFKTNDFIKARLYDQYRLRKVARKRLNLLTRFVNHGSILEFGACTGEFLYEAARKGYDVYSVDKYDAVLNINKTERLKAVAVSDAGLYKDDGKYDAVVAFHLIEHLTDPGGFLAKCHNLLKPGGIILLELPNFGGLSRILLGRRSGIFYDYHLCHFDKHAMNNLLLKYNYRVVHLQTTDEKNRCIYALYNPVRNFLWRLLKKTVQNKDGPSNTNQGITAREINKDNEIEIMNSMKARIYRQESHIINRFAMIFSPTSALLNKYTFGINLQIIARKY